MNFVRKMASKRIHAIAILAMKAFVVVDPWTDLAMTSQADGFRILPLLAISKALENNNMEAAEKSRLIRLATRLSAHSGTRASANALAAQIDQGTQMREWQWHAGLAAIDRGDQRGAGDHFALVRKGDRNFLRARYQQAIIAYNLRRDAQAETIFKDILDAKPAPDRDLQDLTKLGLGRIWYEQKKFQSAAAIYRTVSREGRYFVPALFEQSWAFFMAGFPNHALGAIRGVESPFFKDGFTPEATLLRSMILYWMCLYPQSEVALQEFIARHSDPIDQVENFLARQQLTPESAWQLFENLLAGVSGESLGIPRAVLMTAANSDRMVPVRTGLAQAALEIQMLEGGKLHLGTPKKNGTAAADPTSLIREHQAKLRHESGKAFMAELADLRTQYQQLRAQADFLYVELLTSEKDKLLGKEHLGSNKFAAQKSGAKRPAGWGKALMAWAPDNKQEYWWDEVGFYIDPAKPACMK